jgi:hypothetical protein
MNCKKFADLKRLTDEEIKKNGIPYDFWNYTVNIVTGYSTFKTRNAKQNEEELEFKKYNEISHFTSSRRNGGRYPAIKTNGAEDNIKV